MEHEVNISLEDVQAVANGEELESWGEAQVWGDKVGAEYNLCFDGENCSAIYMMREGEDGNWYTDSTTFEHYEIDPDDPNWKENLIEAMEKYVRNESNV